MKNRCCLFSLLVIFCSLTDARSEPRDWTNSAGKTITAELLGVRDDSVTLKLDNGREYTIPLNTLSEDDQAFATSWQEEQNAIANTPSPATEPLMSVPGKLLYHSDLKTIASDWSIPCGKWEATSTGLTGAEVEADNHAAVFKRSQPLKDVIIEFDIKIGESKSAMFGIDGNGHLCRLTMSQQLFQAKKDDSDKAGPDTARMFNAVEADFETDEWQTVRIELLGEEMLAQAGDYISMGSDPALAGEKAKWGFVVSGESVGFRNLSIWEATRNENWEKEAPRLRSRLDIED
ncbi:MAG: hypothetical protein P1U68_13030 [Verrucomicrobiales bacterium]|nr:hypothetical protein [Verrucomicrobiales bacterium]